MFARPPPVGKLQAPSVVARNNVRHRVIDLEMPYDVFPLDKSCYSPWVKQPFALQSFHNLQKRANRTSKLNSLQKEGVKENER